MSFAMLGGLFSSIKQIFMEIFNYIPKIIYLLYASLASVIDILQLFFRKLAGLDVYYVDGNVRTGDLVTNFIGGILGFTSDGFSYSALTTVFWSFVVFGIIMAFVTTFVAIIKSHYSYDDKAAKGPMQYVYTGVKAIINIAVVPIIVFLGLYVSQALLTALDSISSTSSGTVVAAFGETTNSEGKSISVASRDLRSTKTLTGQTTYVYYDLFGYGSSITYSSKTPANVSETTLAQCASANVTFSGSIFKLAAFNGNRVRTGEYEVGGAWTGGGGDSSGLKLFQNATNEDDLADLVDIAFASNLHLKDSYSLKYGGDGIDAIKYIKGFRALKFNSFSKFNIGLVWYYYDLWSFNFIVGFAACIVCTSLFINIIMGLITRIFMCIGLFLVAPPLFGLAPIDGGKAAKNWQENFIKQALMAYGAVVGMNLMLIILPFMNNIDFFNIAIADLFAQSLIIITGLVSIKAFIAMLSGLIGAADANATGEGVAADVGRVAGKAVRMTTGAAKLAAKAPIVAGKMAVGAGMAAYRGVRTGISAVKTAGHAIGLAGAKVGKFGAGILKKNAERKEIKADKNLNQLKRAQKQDDVLQQLGTMRAGRIDRATFDRIATAQGMSKRERNAMWTSVSSALHTQRLRGGAKNKFDVTLGRDSLAAYDKNYKAQRTATGDFDRTKTAAELTRLKGKKTSARNSRVKLATFQTNASNYATERVKGVKRNASNTASHAVDLARGKKNKDGKRTGGVWGHILKPGSEYAFNPLKNFATGMTNPNEGKGKNLKDGFMEGVVPPKKP